MYRAVWTTVKRRVRGKTGGVSGFGKAQEAVRTFLPRRIDGSLERHQARLVPPVVPAVEIEAHGRRARPSPLREGHQSFHGLQVLPRFFVVHRVRLRLRVDFGSRTYDG